MPSLSLTDDTEGISNSNEIGVRMALGAQPRDVLRMVLGQGMKLTLFGIVPGLAASLALGRVLSHSIFGIAPVEIPLLAGTCLVLTMVAVLACYVPARRAADVDPIEALRRN